jgi:2-polyprenyl-6-methoxyphenol hydroxylase-like FAD-dependent oxidoreductase
MHEPDLAALSSSELPRWGAPHAMRIAISGAGVSGLTLASILGRRLPRTLAALGHQTPLNITVFERAHQHRDQG